MTLARLLLLHVWVVARCVQCAVLSTPFFGLCCTHAVGDVNVPGCTLGMEQHRGNRVRAAPRGMSVAMLRTFNCRLVYY